MNRFPRQLTLPLVCALVGALAATGGLAFAARGSSSGMPPSSGVTTRLPIEISSTNCASAWVAPGPGSTRLVAANNTASAATVRLRHASTGKTVVALRVRSRRHASRKFTLRSGSYQFDCSLSSGVVVQSNVAHVGLDPIPGTPHKPLGPGATSAVFKPVIKAYRQDVVSQLRVVASAVNTLDRQIKQGSLAGAESAWTTAFLDWERLGGTYGSLGDLGLRIPEIPGSLPGGVSDPNFVGFHKVEIDLWQNRDLTTAAAATTQLASLITELQAQFPKDPIAASSIPTRTHEILEDGLRDVLSDDDNFGSGIELAIIEADVRATRQLMTLEAPLLVNRVPALVSQASRQLNHVDTVINSLKNSIGNLPPLSDLTLVQRERVDSAVGGALNILSQFPVALRLGGSGGDAT
jgi:high-affinity iron transporter